MYVCARCTCLVPVVIREGIRSLDWSYRWPVVSHHVDAGSKPRSSTGALTCWAISSAYTRHFSVAFPLALAVIFFFWHEAHARQCAIAKTDRKDLILFIKCYWLCKWRKGFMFSIEKPHIWINLEVLTERFSKYVVVFLLKLRNVTERKKNVKIDFFFKNDHFGS